MELTVWGIIFIPLSFVLILFRPFLLIGILILSLSLQMTTVINFPFLDYGLQLYRFLTILITIYVVIKVLYNRGRIKVQNVYFRKQLTLLFVFLLYVILISIVGPIIFSEYPVFPPLLGLDYSAIYGPSPLELSKLNIAMPLYIWFYSFTFLYLLSSRFREKDIKLLLTIFNISIVLIFFFLIIQLISFFLGTGDILAYINTAPQREYRISVFSYSGYILPRLQGTFGEPSMIAPFIIGIFMYKLAYKEKKITDILSLIFIVLFLLFTISTTAYLSLFFMLLIYFFLNFPVKLTSQKLILQKSKIKIFVSSLFLIMLIFLIVAVVIGLDFILNLISTFIFKKTETLSFFSRTTADLHSLKLFFDTFFIGVGIGSHRSSSLIANLLATTGIVGTILFLLFIAKFIKYSYKTLKGLVISIIFIYSRAV